MMMKVWIDHDECMGAGTCERLAPALFAMGDDGLAYVREGGRTVFERGPRGKVSVPAHLEEELIEAAESCPGECIVIEAD